ncbi:hypothetical protein [Candidatus Epulonipiscium viviparus]|uniref:hypothetical protein n=1 Tax=Candidatus Epulonipiscium viviparus TaxID=420336 RepID=UPI00016C0C47|nr:hypothetical protein [Candidatus Epulopiscium viviparus]
MKISARVQIQKKIKFLRKMRKNISKGRYPKGLYFLCTARDNVQTLEIIQGKFLNESYDECYLIGLAKSKKIILEYLVNIIDEIYNKGTVSLKQLKEKERSLW